jgi:hypothetical protein
LSTIQGQTLMMKDADCQPGKNGLFLDVSDVPPGIYLFRIHNETIVETFKIIISSR